MPILDGRRGGSGWHEVTLQQRRDASQARVTSLPLFSPTPPRCAHGVVSDVLPARKASGAPVPSADETAGAHRANGPQAQYIRADGTANATDLERNSDEFPRMGGGQPRQSGQAQPRGGSVAGDLAAGVLNGHCSLLSVQTAADWPMTQVSIMGLAQQSIIPQWPP